MENNTEKMKTTPSTIEKTVKPMFYINKLVSFLHQPQDPAGLAVFRIIFGLLMVVDVHEERGLTKIEERWERECIFPLFDFLPLPSLSVALFLYFVLLVGAVGITLGLFFRVSSILYISVYWYFFLMDKSRWNNHSYLYGLVSSLLAMSEAHRCWSVDAWRNRDSTLPREVPLWNYWILRFQIALVYFFAGLKKLTPDWLFGYSMEHQGSHQVFDYLRFFLTEHQIDFYVVHIGGLLLDLSMGFLLLHPRTRSLGVGLGIVFHAMNASMFAIGMFPYVMLGANVIFYPPSWPRALLGLPPHENKPRTASLGFRTKAATVGISLYVLLQLTAPWAGGLPGFRTWTDDGLYGTAWDMMVHRWNHVHTRLSVEASGRLFFLDPEPWSSTGRWTRQADMAWQLARCLSDRMARSYNFTDIKVYIDVWVSLNGRFTQRVFDPHTDLLAAPWSPWSQPAWVLPMLWQLDSWRGHMAEIEDELPPDRNVLFVADFPGMVLENFVTSFNTTLEVLEGQLEVRFDDGNVTMLIPGQTVEVPFQKFHRVLARHHQPVMYMYQYSLPPAETVDPPCDQGGAVGKWIIEKAFLWLNSYQLIFNTIIYALV